MDHQVGYTPHTYYWIYLFRTQHGSNFLSPRRSAETPSSLLRTWALCISDMIGIMSCDGYPIFWNMIRSTYLSWTFPEQWARNKRKSGAKLRGISIRSYGCATYESRRFLIGVLFDLFLLLRFVHPPLPCQRSFFCRFWHLCLFSGNPPDPNRSARAVQDRIRCFYTFPFCWYLDT